MWDCLLSNFACTVAGHTVCRSAEQFASLPCPSVPESNWQQKSSTLFSGSDSSRWENLEGEQGLPPPPQTSTWPAAKAASTAALGYICTFSLLMVSSDLLFVCHLTTLGHLWADRAERERCYGINPIKSIKWIGSIKQTALVSFWFNDTVIKNWSMSLGKCDKALEQAGPEYMGHSTQSGKLSLAELCELTEKGNCENP